MKTILQQSINKHRVVESCEAFAEVDALIPELGKHLASIECLSEAYDNRRANDTVRASMEDYNIVAKPNETKPSQIKAALNRAWKWVLEMLGKIKAAFVRAFNWVVEKCRAMARKLRELFDSVVHGKFTPITLKLSEAEATWAPDLKVHRFESSFYKSVVGSCRSVLAIFEDPKVFGVKLMDADNLTAQVLDLTKGHMRKAVGAIWDGKEVPGNGKFPEFCKFDAVPDTFFTKIHDFSQVKAVVEGLKVEVIHEGEVHVGAREIRLESAGKARAFISAVEDYAESLYKTSGECSRAVTGAIDSISARVKSFTEKEGDVNESRNPAQCSIGVLQKIDQALSKVVSLDYKYVAILTTIAGRITRAQTHTPGLPAAA